MKKNHLVWMSFLLICFFTGCKSSYKKTDDGVIISINSDNPQKVKTIRLQVINDNIIHVSATPEEKISEKKV